MASLKGTCQANSASSKGDILSALKGVSLFAGLSQKEAKCLMNLGQETGFKKGQIIFSEGEKGDRVFLILRGKIKIFTSVPRGRIKILGILKEGDLLGEMAMIDEEERTATAEGHEDGQFWVISHMDFMKFIKENQSVTFKMLRTLCHRLREANAHIRGYTFYDQPGRLAQLLLSLHKKFPKKSGEHEMIDLELTHQDLADMMGIARESVTKLLSTLKRHGAIQLQEKHILVTNMEELKSWIR